MPQRPPRDADHRDPTLRARQGTQRPECVVSNEDDGRGGPGGGQGLTTTQFTRHLAQVMDDQTRAALGRWVGEVDATEIVDMARNIAHMKARYVAMALAAASNRQPPTKADAQELRWMRERIEEVELAFQAVKDAVAGEMLPVTGLTASVGTTSRPPLRSVGV